MVRTISTVVLAATLVLSSAFLAGAAPAAEVETCQTSAVGDESPEVLPPGTSCQERAFELEAVIYALESHIRGLQLRIMDLRWRLDHKRKVIQRLRAELRDARN